MFVTFYRNPSSLLPSTYFTVNLVKLNVVFDKFSRTLRLLVMKVKVEVEAAEAREDSSG